MEIFIVEFDIWCFDKYVLGGVIEVLVWVIGVGVIIIFNFVVELGIKSVLVDKDIGKELFVIIRFG